MVSVAGAEIPKKINYQARLTDSSTGEPLAGNANLTFRIYDDAFSSSPIWEESQTLTADSTGVVSAILGSIVAIDIGFSDQAWLEIEVEGEVLTPRREIVSVPYAFEALNAATLGGHSDSSYVLRGEVGSITVEMIVGGTGSGLNADLLDSLSAEAFSDTGHTHDERYYRKEELSTPGTINIPENPVDWTKLKEVPAGFADGTDDTGGAGDGHSLDAADGSPTDVVYVDGAGNVGVGTTTPDDNLDIVGDADLTGDLKIGGRPVFSVDLFGNTVIGADAGYSTEGQNNTFVGFGSGFANTTGFSNVFAGTFSGMANTIGYANTLIGYSSGAANDSGWGNTCIGYLSGNTNIDADINTFIGYYSGKANTVGDGNTFLGAMSGWQNTGGGYNTCLGGGTGYSNIGGNNNTCVGYGAGQYNTDGDGNVFLGSHAGFLETGSNKLYIANDVNDPPLMYGDFATKQVGIGTKALQAELDVAGTCNVSTAYSIAGSTVVAVPGDYNTHLGMEAGAEDTGTKGTFVGYHAGYLNEEIGNTFVGTEAGKRSTSGRANTFIGADAGKNNGTGISNTCIGSSAGMFMQDGGHNTYIGSTAGSLTGTSSRNTVVGFGAGTMCGSDNVILGYQAGAVALGSSKLYIANGGSDNEVLIYGDFSTGQLSFGCVKSEYTFEFESASTKAFKIGNADSWIDISAYGNSRVGFGDGDGNEAGTIFGAENMGGHNIIGIWGIGDGGSGVRGTYFHQNGNVGIGTDDPERELHIVSDNPRILIEASTSNPEIDLKSSGDASNEVWAVYKDSGTNDLRFYQGSDKVTIEGGTGNVGIGTTDPGSCKLYVNGGAGGTGAWGSCSDLRFKHNIGTIGDALGKVLSLRGVTFNWKRDQYPDKHFDEGTHYGCVAQEVEVILPEVVREGPDGGKAIAYSEIVPVLIESIKDQQHQIEELRAEVSHLRAALEGRD
jgi:hypothetical protein